MLDHADGPGDDATGLLTTAEAADRLGVKPATLYAYVSRGLVTARKVPGRRTSFYDPADVDELAQRGRNADVKQMPLGIRSSITLIEDGRFWYRGTDPATLIIGHSYESVASFLWTGVLTDDETWTADPADALLAARIQESLPPSATPVDRLRLIIATISSTDQLRYDLTTPAVTATARRLIATSVVALGQGRDHQASVATGLCEALGGPIDSRAAVAAVNAALITMADHELAGSTLAARVAAAFRADPIAVVTAGLGALAGSLHGGASLAAEQLIREVIDTGEPEGPIGRRIRDGLLIPGLGQPLYPNGDPRASVLLAAARRAAPASPANAAVDAIINASAQRGFPLPNVDLGLATVATALDLIPGSSEVLFAVGRMAGWIAHAIEEYSAPSNMRRRAIYTGPRPG